MYVSLGKAARRMGVTTGTVRHWTDSGFLPCTRTAGGHRRIDTQDLEELARAIGDGGHLAARRVREREVETLAQISIDVASRLDQVELLAEIARHVTRLCACHTCEILEYDPDADAVRVLAEYDARGGRRPTAGVFSLADLPVTRHVLEEHEAIVVNADQRGADPAEVALMRIYGERSILMLPLVFQGRSIGLLEACDRERPRSYSAQELRLARALAGQAAVALRNAQLYAAARDADAAVAGLRQRLQLLARELRRLTPAQRGTRETGDALAEVVRVAFAACSCVVADGARVLGAAADATPDHSASESRSCTAHILRTSADSAPGQIAITLGLPRPAEPGDIELLELMAATVQGRLAALGTHE
jgi:excisionase family DNA binding protein